MFIDSQAGAFSRFAGLGDSRSRAAQASRERAADPRRVEASVAGDSRQRSRGVLEYANSDRMIVSTPAPMSVFEATIAARLQIPAPQGAPHRVSPHLEQAMRHAPTVVLTGDRLSSAAPGEKEAEQDRRDPPIGGGAQDRYAAARRILFA